MLLLPELDEVRGYAAPQSGWANVRMCPWLLLLLQQRNCAVREGEVTEISEPNLSGVFSSVG